jgi:site-specific DNA-methyltransferase (adenine-specific)
VADNYLYYGDNLDVLRQHIASESVDLVYLDPPFNSNATYNVLFAEHTGEKAASQIKAFEDTWTWDEEAARAYFETVQSGGEVANALKAFYTLLGESNMMAYLAMMAPRLVELRRVLKPTGSIYLHCDPTASHYLKLLMDSVFRPDNFRSEVVWKRTGAHNSAKRYGPVHDTLLYYARTGATEFRSAMAPYAEEYVHSHFGVSDERGRYQSVTLTGPGTRTGDSGLPWRGYDPTAHGRHWQPASYVYSKYNELTGEGESYYLMASYRFVDWFTLGGYYSIYYPNMDDRDGDTTTVNNVPVDHRAWEKDLALTLRFDINEYWIFKVEGHAVDGTANVLITDNNGNDFSESQWYYGAAKLTFNF